MAQGVIDLGRPEGQQTRTELTLGRIGREWRLQLRGGEFTQALLDFLRSLSTNDTLRSYSFSVLQFWDWYEQTRGRLLTPDLITRADAVEYDRWLRDHIVPMTKWRLQQDPARRLDLAIYEFVERSPGASIGAIREYLSRYGEFATYEGGRRFLALEPPGQPGGLHRHLGCLVKRRTLARTPTVAELRRESGHLITPDEGVFRYFVPEVTTPEGAERASTIATRLSALSALWAYMIQAGENIPGRREALLQFNIWLAPLKQAQAQAPSHREVTRARKTPTLELYLRVLATTFVRTHGGAGAFAAAEAAFWGQPVPPALGGKDTSFKDLRDRALLLLMAQTGLRSREIHRLRRDSLAAGDPPVLTVIGKRRKVRAIGLPPVVGDALRALDDKIQLLAAHQDRYGRPLRAAALLAPKAPLLPAVAYWGANAGQTEQGLTRPGIAQVLRRRAAAAGIDPGTPEFARAHPHGLRHLYAKIALETTPPHRVRAIMGHASLATTGRYAEERDPGLLVAEAFRGVPSPTMVAPLYAPATPLRPAHPILPERMAIRAPAAPPGRPEPPPPPPPPAPEPALEPAVVRRIERVERVAPPIMPAQPTPLKAIVAAAAAPAFDAFVAQAIGYRKKAKMKPLSEKQIADLARCASMANESLRNLCVIYDVHWGEDKNRQELVPTGGGTASVAAKRKAKLLKPNQDDEEEDEEDEEEEIFEEFEDEGIDIASELAAIETEEKISLREEVERIERVEHGLDLYSEAGTDKVARIYSGKDSGLSWWTGTNGKLKPAMPVMSPDQVGECAPGAEGEVCGALVKLWRQWADDSPTKAEALVAWVGEALDLTAQMQAVVLARGARWVSADAPWLETRYEGTHRHPKPRMVFREHLSQAIIAWFEERGDSYRVSPGDPTTWLSKTAKPKVREDAPPAWFGETDPITALPPAERRELIDWMLALTGQLPVDREPRYGVDAAVASRADVAQFVNALCQFDGSIDALRESAQFGPSYVARLWKLDSVDDFPAKIRADYVALQRQARELVRRATMGKVSDFDAFDVIRRRVRGAKTKKTRVEITGERQPLRVESAEQDVERAELEALLAEQAAAERKTLIPNQRQTRQSWALALVRKHFGPDAAKDPAIQLVAKCGQVPLGRFRDLFRVEGGTIAHEDTFKAAFARQHGTHSECVARRIARRLWELKKRSPRSEYITKPQHMVTLVDVMETFKVPCTRAQERELAFLAKLGDSPRGIYDKWSRLRTSSTEVALTEAEQIQRDLAEEYEQEIAREQVREVFRENPARSPAIPTPIHLTCALMVGWRA